MNISQKLLSTVLSELLEEVNRRRVKDWLVLIEKFDSISIKDNKVYFHESKQNTFPYKPVGEHTINIYEFAFKCKEWVISQGIAIESGKYEIDDKEYICRYYLSGKCSGWQNYFGSTELEAIFKACESILDEISN